MITAYTDAVVIGIGGVGIPVAENLCRHLVHTHPRMRVTLIDGDHFEPRNRERQAFDEMGNKAQVKRDELAKKFPELVIQAVPEFITADTAYLYIPDKSIVFCCPDNHATRKLVSDHCSTLEDTLLISGGNAFDSGSLQLYKRKGGSDITHPLTHLHPEIQVPQDRNPAEMSCDERAAAGTPQIVFANLGVAARMLEALWMATSGEEIKWHTRYFDLATGADRAIRTGE